MTRPQTPDQVFHELVHGVAAGRGAELAQLYAENTNVVHPMDPMRTPGIRSRAELEQHFATEPTDAALPAFEPVDIVVHQTIDPEVIVAEFAYRVTSSQQRPTIDLPCVFVMRVRNGLIVESRDYTDHLGLAILLGEADPSRHVATGIVAAEPS